MNTKLLTLLACIAWSGVAVASASPAEAVAITGQSGAYANCSNDTEPYAGYYCGYTTSYIQGIKFASVSCNSGGCTGTRAVHADFIYSPGRKVTTFWQVCGTRNVYGLDTCAC